MMMTRKSEPAAVERDRAAARRRKIVTTARRLFIENGFHATGVAQIATESGVAVGQIYRDFASKEAIVASISEADCIDFLAHDTLLREIDNGNIEAIWAWLRDFLDRGHAESGILITEILAESTRNPTIATIFERSRRDVRSTMLVALEALAPGEEHAARRMVLADLVLALSLGLLQHRLMDEVGDTASVVETALRIIRTEVSAMRAGVTDQLAPTT